MGFFDLNIPYLESDRHVKDKAARKSTRLKLIVKAMELGYTGVAYNRTIKGVMSELDHCSTSLFPLSSILKLTPSLSTSIKLHRELLNVPMSTPFRQYRRLTVAVDSPAQAAALNSGNPVLKSYDIVAVQPLNQNAFDQACQASEVDIIAIDFSDKMPFRLKQPMIKAAIARGVYIEITYSGLIMDAQLRRQIISNAKLLVDWTRGKNLIFSSAAPSVTELRGPNDVANVSLLLGLTMERAKAAISKNCRSLIASALRKKQCYKEAIRIEGIGEQSDSKKALLDDWLNWDPISSGEGDLLLDDMAKSFSVCDKISKTVKAIDFASIVDRIPSYGLEAKNFLSTKKATNVSKNVAAAEEFGAVVAVNLFPVTDQTSESGSQLEHQVCVGKDSVKLLSSTDEPKDSTDVEEFVIDADVTEEELKSSNGQDTISTPLGAETQDLRSQTCKVNFETHIISPDENVTVCSLVQDMNFAITSNIVAEAVFPKESKNSNIMDVDLAVENVTTEVIPIETDICEDEDLLVASSDVMFLGGTEGRERSFDREDDSVIVADELQVVESFGEMRDDNHNLVTNFEPLKEVRMEDQDQSEHQVEIINPISDKTLLGRRRLKQKTTNQSIIFPLKRLLHPVPFKRRLRKSKKTKKL